MTEMKETIDQSASERMTCQFQAAMEAVRKALRIETLQTPDRRHEISEAAIRDAVEMAFNAGVAAEIAAADAKRLERIRLRAFKFTTPAAALHWCQTSTSRARAMLADDGKVWAVTPADAAWMETKGFEYAA